MKTDSTKIDLRKEPGVAVLLVHGIGQQRPMDTLREFVKAVKACLEKFEKQDGEIPYFNKPDTVGGNYETRLLRLLGSENRRKIDFYEFYWANMMNDTQMSYFTGWIVRLLFERPGRIPKHLFKVWLTIWIVLLSALAVIAVSAAGLLPKLTIPVIVLALWPTVYGIVNIFFRRVMTQYVGDAGRYFMPDPQNIDVRYRIRSRGLELLRRLHDGKKYSRIIVVGHSLGSVIGYDLLRLLWPEYSKPDSVVEVVDREALERAMDMVDDFATGKTRLDAEAFQRLQSKCLDQQNQAGLQWRVSDFITIGSPLPYIDYLTPRNVRLNTSVPEREFPSCPPVADENGHIFYRDQLSGMPILHHAALFAVTRWTNLYFDTDPIGGPACNVFRNYVVKTQGYGKGSSFVTTEGTGGILDKLLPERFSLLFSLGGHTKYWDRCACQVCKSAGCDVAIGHICKALRIYAY